MSEDQSKINLLLIEDNQDVRENTAELLELSGYSVEVAENGKQGVEKAKAIKPDLIICDIMMPQLDGHGVLYMLSKDSHTAAIPFIFLTAKTERDDLRKGMEMGADDYLTKPFTEMELLNAVESRLGKNEILKKEYAQDVHGIQNFMQEAKEVAELKELSEDSEVTTYKPKEEIYTEGGYPKWLFFINQGKVKTYKTHEAGKGYITDIHKSGDFIGYTALLKDAQYEENAVAMEETEIVKIPKSDFYTLIYNNRDVANKFIKMISNNLSEREQRLMNLAYDSVRKRVAEALVYINNRSEKGEQEDGVINMSREDLASVVGTAKETVIRTLSEFKEEGLITIQGRSIYLTNKEKLSNLLF